MFFFLSYLFYLKEDRDSRRGSSSLKVSNLKIWVTNVIVSISLKITFVNVYHWNIKNSHLNFKIPVTWKILKLSELTLNNRQGSGVSNFIGMTKRLHHTILLFLGNDTKKWFLTNLGQDKTPKGSRNTANFGKTSLFIQSDYEQQTSTRLWIVRANK